MHTITHSHLLEDSHGMHIFCALTVAMTLVACDQNRDEVSPEALVVIERPEPIVLTRDSPPRVAPDEQTDVAIEDFARVIDEVRDEASSPDPSANTMSDARIDGLVSDALATKEGRQMLAPLFERDVLEAEANDREEKPTQVVIRVRDARDKTPTQQEERGTQTRSSRQGYYVGTGYVDAVGRAVFIDPTGQPVDAAGLATSTTLTPPGAYNVSPSVYTSPRRVNNRQASTTSSPLISQVPPRSSLPSQVPTNAGNMGSAPAVGPAISGPGVAGF